MNYDCFLWNGLRLTDDNTTVKYFGNLFALSPKFKYDSKFLLCNKVTTCSLGKLQLRHLFVSFYPVNVNRDTC